MDSDQDRGLYAKYQVNKIIRGTDQRGEESETLLPVTEQCFVLKETDPFAPVALRAYADACYESYPSLSEDLTNMAARWDDQ